MRQISSILPLIVLILQTICTQAGQISLPHGIQWGDDPGKLVDWAVQHQWEVSIIIPAKRPDERIVRVSNLGSQRFPNSIFNELEARYEKGRLIEVSESLDDSLLTAATVKTRFLELKKKLSTDYGAFRVNRRSDQERNQFGTESTSYHCEPIPGLFVLITHTEVEDRLRQVRQGKFSVVYRNENLKAQLLAPPAAP